MTDQDMGQKETSRLEAFSDGVFAIAITLLFNLLWHYAVRGNRLIDKDTSPRWVKRINRQYLAGPLLYLAAFIVSSISVVASIAITVGLAIFFALPVRTD